MNIAGRNFFQLNFVSFIISSRNEDQEIMRNPAIILDQVITKNLVKAEVTIKSFEEAIDLSFCIKVFVIENFIFYLIFKIVTFERLWLWRLGYSRYIWTDNRRRLVFEILTTYTIIHIFIIISNIKRLYYYIYYNIFLLLYLT